MVDELGEYDVLLGMSREHARELLALAPEARARIFTLKQFARWLETHQRPADVDVGTWLDATAGQRSPWDLIGSNPADDVEDPLGQPIDHWRAMTADLQPAIDGVLAGLFPSAPRPV
jgi:protein-tyrosine-phosphatase